MVKKHIPTIGEMLHAIDKVFRYGADAFVDENSGVSNYTPDLRLEILRLLRDAGLLEWQVGSESLGGFPVGARLTMSGLETAKVFSSLISQQFYKDLIDADPSFNQWMTFGLFTRLSTERYEEAMRIIVAEDIDKLQRKTEN